MLLTGLAVALLSTCWQHDATGLLLLLPLLYMMPQCLM
jgi:hypothetical protein